MSRRWKSTRTLIGLALLWTLVSACQQGGGLGTAWPWINAAFAGDGSTNGAAGQMPAFYDSTLFTVNILQLSDTAAQSIIAHNKSHNTIYASNDLDEEQEFMPVLDAIQGDGFNPLWLQVLIVFNEGFTPHQFFSDNEILAAAAGPDPEITLVDTGEVYRCAVVGKK
jgi:hypothetical protein